MHRMYGQVTGCTSANIATSSSEMALSQYVKAVIANFLVDKLSEFMSTSLLVGFHSLVNFN